MTDRRARWVRLAVVTAVASPACADLSGRAPRDASADAANAPDAADATGTPAPDVPRCVDPALRVDGLVDRYVPADGSPDAGVFGASSPRAVAADTRGGLYLAGACVRCGVAPRAAVWRVLAATGQPDGAWGLGGRAFDGSDSDHALDFWSLAVDDAGREVAAGYAAVGSFAWPSVARFTADGAPDLSFGEGGRIALEPRRFGAMVANGYALRAVPSGDGVLVVGVDEPPSERPGARALVARLRASDGSLDASFGEGGALLRGDLRGCFDARPDGDGWVALCQSTDQRPTLLRLDARGAERAWAGGSALAVHAAAPAGMHARALLPDAAGGWLAVGAVLRDYADGNAPPAVVRFAADGATDRAYGVAGLAQLSGVRQTPRYTFSSAAARGCDDRLLVGANLDARPYVAVLDRAGRLVDAVGERGYIALPVPRDATVAALTGVAVLPGTSRALVLTNFQPTAFSLQSLGP